MKKLLHSWWYSKDNRLFKALRGKLSFEQILHFMSFRQQLMIISFGAFSIVGVFAFITAVASSNGYAFGINTCCGSMEPEIKNGCVTISEKISKDSEEITIGDIATYYSPEHKSFIQHRVIAECTDGGLLFKGDNNEVADGCVERSLVIQKLVGKICVV